MRPKKIWRRKVVELEAMVFAKTLGQRTGSISLICVLSDSVH